jgi:hypothetical protein
MTIQTLIRTDARAALVSAIFVLLCKTWLADWLCLPENVLAKMCAVAFCYGAYSSFLHFKNPKPLFLIKILIFANAFWATFCIGIIVYHWATINRFGIAYLLAEAMFVGGLAFLENKYCR